MILVGSLGVSEEFGQQQLVSRTGMHMYTHIHHHHPPSIREVHNSHVTVCRDNTMRTVSSRGCGVQHIEQLRNQVHVCGMTVHALNGHDEIGRQLLASSARQSLRLVDE